MAPLHEWNQSEGWHATPRPASGPDSRNYGLLTFTFARALDLPDLLDLGQREQAADFLGRAVLLGCRDRGLHLGLASRHLGRAHRDQGHLVIGVDRGQDAAGVRALLDPELLGLGHVLGVDGVVIIPDQAFRRLRGPFPPWAFPRRRGSRGSGAWSRERWAWWPARSSRGPGLRWRPGRGRGRSGGSARIGRGFLKFVNFVLDNGIKLTVVLHF